MYDGLMKVCSVFPKTDIPIAGRRWYFHAINLYTGEVEFLKGDLSAQQVPEYVKTLVEDGSYDMVKFFSNGDDAFAFLFNHLVDSLLYKNATDDTYRAFPRYGKKDGGVGEELKDFGVMGRVGGCSDDG